MRDLAVLTVLLIVVVDPLAAVIAAGTLTRNRPARDRAVVVGAGVAGAAVLLGAAALAADPILDALDVSPPSALLAAGVVVFVAALALLWGGPAGRVTAAPGAPPARLALFPFAVPVLVSPAAVAAVIAWSADRGLGVTCGALVVTLAVVGGACWAAPGPISARAARIGGGFTGLAAAIVAFDLARDGVFGP